jgi:fatty acid desaturase
LSGASVDAVPTATLARDIRSLSVVRNWRGLAKLALVLFAIGVSVLCADLALAHHGPWLLWPIAFLASVWGQHAASEEIHDGVHYRLLNGHRANDALSAFYASFVGISFREFRATHLLHHRHFGKPTDPDYPKYAKRPGSRAGWIRYVTGNFSGAAAVRRLVAGSIGSRDPVRRFGQYPVGTAAVQLVLWGVTWIVVSPFWYPLCWVLPLITVTYGVTQFRTLLEHWKESTSDDRSTGGLFNLGGEVQKHIFAAQFGYNRHGTHHQHPSVPNYNLARLDRSLAGNTDWTTAVTSTSYSGRVTDVLRGSREITNRRAKVLDSTTVADDVAQGGTFLFYWQTLRTDPGKIARGLWDSLTETARFVIRPRVPVRAGFCRRIWLVARFVRAEAKIPGGTTTLETIWLAYGAASATTNARNWVEVGCFKGLSTARLSLLCDLYDDHLNAYDTFEGLPGSDAVYESTDGGVSYLFKAGSYAGTDDEVRSNVAAHGRPERVTLVKGNVRDTMRDQPLIGGLRFAFLDVDLVESYEASFAGLSDSIERGTVIMTHEACYQPIRRLLEDAAFWESIGCGAPKVVYVADTYGIRSCRNLAILTW